MFCRSLFVLLCFFIWSLYCVSFDVRLLITSQVSSNFSHHTKLQLSMRQCSYSGCCFITSWFIQVLNIYYSLSSFIVIIRFFLDNYCQFIVMDTTNQASSKDEVHLFTQFSQVICLKDRLMPFINFVISIVSTQRLKDSNGYVFRNL